MDYTVIITNSGNSNVTVGKMHGTKNEITQNLIDMAIRDFHESSEETWKYCADYVSRFKIDCSEPNKMQLVIFGDTQPWCGDEIDMVYTAVADCAINADFSEIGTSVEGTDTGNINLPHDYIIRKRGLASFWEITISKNDITKTFFVEKCPMQAKDFEALTNDELNHLLSAVVSQTDAFLRQFIYASIYPLIYGGETSGYLMNGYFIDEE